DEMFSAECSFGFPITRSPDHRITRSQFIQLLSCSAKKNHEQLDRGFHSLLTDSPLPAAAGRYMLRPVSLSQTMAKLFEPPRYIAIEGSIRVGKSTLANIIAGRLNAQRVIEPEDNPFLQAFYEGQRGAAFQAQFAFLVRRFEQLQQLEVGPQSHKTVVADYIF